LRESSRANARDDASAGNTGQKNASVDLGAMQPTAFTLPLA